ncbi:DUF4180 domain-containing protein [Sphingobacterium sp. DK4209]|uniref:DUF4180 domain-containing protein n=1 Tax=Sphingobacterium zhuxiongii TaxID=2662364 RepID=A0A5Q0QGK7_9SPHI|nr:MULTISPECIES: DUF4180 domain-containing protein [unclassified Sphingobacterium]MVZ66608.1 DUF4180 domain-containing protein [Sphingobacterium sp. DK4209]QGA26792.1 DUF4180 domain-containing protein [Sphingobacterium sp. dk4302]
MTIDFSEVNKLKIAEVIADDIVLSSTEDALAILGDLYFQEVDRLFIYERNIIPVFFDLKSRIAGDILQKFTQYQMPVSIIGDFSNYQSKSLRDFIFESNQGKQIHFCGTKVEAIEMANRLKK